MRRGFSGAVQPLTLSMSESEIARVVQDGYGLTVLDQRRLGGEVDHNVWIKTDDGQEFLFKGSVGPVGDSILWQERVLSHLARGAPQLPVPRLIVARSGATLLSVNMASVPVVVRLLEYDRSSVTELMERFDRAAPVLSLLPTGVVHHDLNDFNVLAAPDGDGRWVITGVIDVNDSMFTIRIAELTIAIAYAMLRHRDPVRAAASVAAGPNSVVPIAEQEIKVVFPLAGARLYVNATTWKRRTIESHHPYGEERMRHTWPALHKVARISTPEAEAKLRIALSRPRDCSNSTRSSSQGCCAGACGGTSRPTRRWRTRRRRWSGSARCGRPSRGRAQSCVETDGARPVRGVQLPVKAELVRNRGPCLSLSSIRPALKASSTSATSEPTRRRRGEGVDARDVAHRAAQGVPLAYGNQSPKNPS